MGGADQGRRRDRRMTREPFSEPRRHTMQRTVIAVSLAYALASLQCVHAQEWPTRAMSMVVPFAAGGGADAMGRILAAKLSDVLGQQVVVENSGGAGGMSAAARIAKATPDGYQFLLGTGGTQAQNQSLYKNPLYNAATDFTPVALFSQQPVALMTRKDLPPNTFKEFIAYAKAHQGTMQYGSAGTGSSVQLACVLLNAATGLKVTHVPYRGSAPAMQDLIAGRIDYQCANIGPSIPQIEGKLVKPIAILTKNRTPILPSLPSAHEQGLTDFDAVIWYGVFLPKGTPAAIVQKLNAAVVAVANMPVVQKWMMENGADLAAPDQRSPDYLQKFVESEIEKWAGPIKASGQVVE
jgi:tripartite-type tricarboxylate transporter receptor subunit TctC